MHSVFDSDVAVVPERVSVVMPMRNPGAYLPAAVGSVLSQDVADLQLVIVDDGSTDGSREWVEALADARITVVDGPRKGISACMNRGLARAQGGILMRCDADDLYPPGRISSHVRWLQAHAGHMGVCGTFSMIAADGAPVSSPVSRFTETVVDAAPRILDHSLWTHLCSFTFRRAALQGVGGFREYFETSEDADFLLRLAAAGPVGFLPHDAYLYRIHGASITHTGAAARRRFFEGLAHEMSRDRLATGSDALMRGQPPVVPTFADADQAPTTADEHVAQLLVGEAWQAFGKGRRLEALGRAARAIRIAPGTVDAWKALVLVCVKRRQRA
ncbi:MAG: glycosyltransferase [Betaproteobacteria bacterium]